MRIYSAPNMAMVAHIRNVLEAHEIPCTVRGEFRGTMAGEIPPIECWPELWLLDESLSDLARAIIREAIETHDPSLPPWQCPSCKEEIEGQFATCWNCATDRPVL